MTTIEKPLPDVTNPLTAAYWSAAREHRLVVPRCTNCGYTFWPPEVVCPECQHTDFAWDEVAQSGTLWSYATYYRALDAAFADELPYTVGLIDLGKGIKMYGIMRTPPQDVVIGQRVEAVFEDVTPEVTMVRWAAATE